MKSYTLPSNHYAANWPTAEETWLNTDELTDLGCQYARAEDQQKQDLLLRLCQAFHGYLIKYMVMICRGHVPQWQGMNSDSAKFLAYFMHKNGKFNADTARSIARFLHLAFKEMDSGEVYDVLMQQFLTAAAKYDPDYTKKIKLVVESIEHEKHKTIRVVDVNRHLEFDADRYLRVLARRGFLEAVKAKGGKISGWVRSGQWPPPVEFFQSGPIGFAYYVQTWFRYYLQQWIEKRQSELETKEGVYSYGLRGGKVPKGYSLRAGNIDGTFLHAESEEVAQPGGKHSPTRVLADNELAERALDVSKLNIEWVDHTEDPLFQDLGRNR